MRDIDVDVDADVDADVSVDMRQKAKKTSTEAATFTSSKYDLIQFVHHRRNLNVFLIFFKFIIFFVLNQLILFE